MSKDSNSKPQYLVSVFRQDGEWDSQGIKTLRAMGFSQQLEVDGNPVATPRGVFVKYEQAKYPSELRDKIMDKIEDNITTKEGEHIYVVVTDDLVPLMVEEMKTAKRSPKEDHGTTKAGKNTPPNCGGEDPHHHHKKQGSCGCGCGH